MVGVVLDAESGQDRPQDQPDESHADKLSVEMKKEEREIAAHHQQRCSHRLHSEFPTRLPEKPRMRSKELIHLIP